MSYINLEVDNNIAFVTLNRPPHNILNRDMMIEFADVMNGLNVRNDVRVVLLKSAVPNFSAGADIRYIQAIADYKNKNDAELKAEMEITTNMAVSIVNCRFPVVVAACGRLIGGGAVIAACADVRLASEGTIFNFPEISMGWIGASAFVESMLPRRLARYYVFTGKPFTAEEARAYGGLLDVVPANQLEERAMKVCKEIARMAPLAVQYFKAAMNHNDNDQFYEKFMHEYQYSMRHCKTDDFKESINAFLEKRKPVYTGK